MNGLLRDLLLSRGLFEHEGYLAGPAQGNASEFIARALEHSCDQIAKRERYVGDDATGIYLVSEEEAGADGK